MVKRNYKRRKTTKTIAKKSLKAPVPRNMVVMGKGFPKKMIVKQMYNDTVVLTSTGASATPVSLQFSLNGMYDPYLSGFGHQPMYFDQYSALYNHYTVVGSKVIATVIGYESNTLPAMVTLWQNDDTTITPTIFSAMEEQSKSKALIIGSDGSASKSLSLKWSAKKTFGGSVLGNTLLRGTSIANPAEQSVAVLSMIAGDQFTSVNVVVRIQIEYIAVWDELKDMPGS